ncbi:MAG: hypothetical protein ACI9BF_000823 [Candidatus Paceibacteria bacterium]|jgi:hypothetical protein
MKRFSEQLHKQSTTVKLRVAEKRELRERLVSYMEYHPLPADMKVVKPVKKIKSATVPLFTDSFDTFSIPFATIFKTSAFAAVLILLVVPFVAEKAIPGDTFYAIKVQFNEELRSTLTFDSYQKVEWETERLNRRIAEARLLASEGRLTKEVEAEVADAVRAHTNNAKREIEELRTQDADAATIASIALDSTLEVQSTSLKGEGSGVTTGAITTMNTRPTNLIADAIDESRGEVETYTSSSTPPAYDKLMARVEQNTTRVYELLDNIKEVAPALELAEVTRRIEDIERSIQVAIELNTEEGNEAQLQLIDVLQRTQKLIVYMTEIEVTETIDIETLVPVELTEVEQDQAVENLTKELKQKLGKINELLTRVEDEDVVKKVEFALDIIAAPSMKMSPSSDNLSAFRLVSGEALAIADDMIVLLERSLQRAEELVTNESATTTYDGVDIEIEDVEQATSTEEFVEEIEESGEVSELEELNGSSTDTVNIQVDSNISSTTIEGV